MNLALVQSNAMRALIIVSVLALTLLACTSQTTEEAITETVQDFLMALGVGDFQTMDSFMPASSPNGEQCEGAVVLLQDLLALAPERAFDLNVRDVIVTNLDEDTVDVMAIGVFSYTESDDEIDLATMSEPMLQVEEGWRFVNCRPFAPLYTPK